MRSFFLKAVVVSAVKTKKEKIKVQMLRVQKKGEFYSCFIVGLNYKILASNIYVYVYI